MILMTVEHRAEALRGPLGSAGRAWFIFGVRRADEVGAVVGGLAATMAAAGYSERDQFGVRLALEEAVVNGLRHGNGGDPSKEVRVCYAVSPQEVLAEVEDEGPGFDPDAVPDPLAPENLERSCGRGLLLMRHYLTEVRYNARGNAVTLRKRRSPA
jgi:serine/threonine-protein kinase RsbW